MNASRSIPAVYAWSIIVITAALFVSAFLSVKLGVLLLIFVAVGWWVWENPATALIFLVIVSPLLPMFKATQTLGNITLIKDVIILGLFARLYAIPLLQQKLPYRRNILFAPLVLLAAWVAVSLLRADSVTLGVLRAREVLLYPLLYLAVLYLPTSTRFRQQLTTWSLTVLGILALLSAYQWFAAADSAVLRFDPARSIWIPRLSATLGHPSVLGEYLVMAASFALAHLISRRRPVALAITALILSLGLIYLTYSRAVWLGLVVSFTTILLAFFAARFTRHGSRSVILKRAGVTVTVTLILAIMSIYFTPVGVFVRTAFDPTYRSNEIRLEFLSRLIGSTSNSTALFGAGLGDVVAQNFRQVEVTSYDLAAGESRSVQLAKDSTLVDNQHLKTFIEMGLAGLLIYAWLYWRLGYHAWQLFRRAGEEEAQQLNIVMGLGTLGFLTSFIIQGFFIDIWDVFPTNLFFWLIAGLLSARVSSAPSKNVV